MNVFFVMSKSLIYLLNVSHLQVLEIIFLTPLHEPLGWLISVLSLYFVLHTLIIYLFTSYQGALGV